MAENEYEPGSMDIRAQEQTFAGFVRFILRFAAAAIVVLIFLAIVDG